MAEEKYHPRGIGQNWLACFVCNGIKDGYLDLDSKTLEPVGKPIPSVRYEDGIHYGGGYHSCQPDMAAFVDDREAGQRVIEMFEGVGARAFLDFRDFEPNRVQVKIGACEQHKPNLEKLGGLTVEAGGMITPEIIQAAFALK